MVPPVRPAAYARSIAGYLALSGCLCGSSEAPSHTSVIDATTPPEQQRHQNMVG
jgi:hypothetical protein